MPLSGPIRYRMLKLKAACSRAEAEQARDKALGLFPTSDVRLPRRSSSRRPILSAILKARLSVRGGYPDGILRYRGSKTTMTCTSDYATVEVLDMRSAAHVDPVRSSAPLIPV